MSIKLTPASIEDQSLNTIGRSPWADPFFKGEVAAFRVYDRALTASEVNDVSHADAVAHAVAEALLGAAGLAACDPGRETADFAPHPDLARS